MSYGTTKQSFTSTIINTTKNRVWPWLSGVFTQLTGPRQVSALESASKHHSVREYLRSLTSSRVLAPINADLFTH